MKILIIRIGRVGDMLMITPAVRALIDTFPDAEFHMLTSADGKRVFSDFAPQLTTFLLHDRKKPLSKLGLKKLLGKIHLAAYDSAYCFELNPTFMPFYQAAGDGGHCIEKSRPQEHYARRCLDVVEHAIARPRPRPVAEYWLNLPITDEARIKAKSILLEEGIADEAFVIGLHPTYSGMKKKAWRSNKDAERRWPAASFSELAIKLSSFAEQHQLNIKIIMDLMPEEVDVGEKIVRLSDNKVIMMTPPLDFQRYKATLERMNLFVTTDTGPMHIAGAMGTTMVALFGGSKPDDCGAYVPAEQRRFVKSATQQIADITPEEVFEACKQFLPV